VSRILAALAAIAGVIAFIFRGQAKAAKAEAKQQKARADSAEAAGEQHRRTNDALTAVEMRHREEQKDAQQHLDDGRREHLDGDW
jgi:hypothetical protein